MLKRSSEMLLRTRARGRAVMAGLGLSAFLLVALASGSQAQTQDSASVAIADGGSLGPILTDINGVTLYMFARDPAGTSTCNGRCAAVWPPLLTDTDPLAPPDLGGGLDTTIRLDGSRQVTYNGVPLYRYLGDTQPGDVTGQGIDSFGGLWFVVNPAA